MKEQDEKTSILYRLKQQAYSINIRPTSKEAWNFYISKLKLLRTPLRKSPGFANDSELISISNVKSGMLVYFGYEAITENLPFWDAYPMDLIIDHYQDPNNGKFYMTAINFHYIPVNVRYRVMIKIIEQYNYWNMNNKNIKRLSGINYHALRDLLASSGFGFAYKKYLVEQVRTNFYQIPLVYMPQALALDTAQWQNGATNSSVWSKYASEALKGKF